ncbi:MAG: divergent polysaccharide deacetylase family protein [Smithella sp.]|jgi:hypothetical protein
MKLFKKLFTAAIIILIIVSIGGIIYVLQFQEETPAIKETKKAAGKTIKKAVVSKRGTSKALSSKSVPLREVAIIIDDIGYDLNLAKELLKINADLTFAIVPFQAHSREAAQMFHNANKETLLHLPMEPVSYPREKPGEGALFTDMSDEEIVLQLKENLAAVPYISGVNNHMGSKFMMDEQKLSLIFKELKKRNLFFVDSRTSADTRTLSAAQKTGIKVAERKIFIDNNRNYKEIYNNLMKVAQGDDVSPKIIIGHPYPETVRALKAATEVLREKGVLIVPASQIIKKTKTS